ATGLGDGAVLSADLSIKIPEETDARDRTADAWQSFVVRVGTHAEKADGRVVEHLPELLQFCEHSLARGVRRRPKKAKDDVAPRGRVELKVRHRRAAGDEPRRGFADGE